MKIRQGFVSNSSSSSFCIYGICKERDEIENIIKSKNKEATEEDEEDEEDCFRNFLEDIRDEEVSVYNIYDEDLVYIGKSLTQMELDETRRQFQSNIEDKITKLFQSKLNMKISNDDFDIYERDYPC